MKTNRFLHYWEKEDKGGILFFILRILSFLYLIGYIIRKSLYSLGSIKSKNLKARVISIGNITTGGSGKTPFVLYLAKKLKEKGINFAILTRGYKRLSKDSVVLKKIESPEIKWEQVGDEPYLLSNHLSETPIIIDKDRFHSGKIAQDKYKADLLLLDDGFQHWRLKRDLDIVMIESSIDLEKEKLLPAGRLREPLSSLKRSNVFVLTRVDQSIHIDNLIRLLQVCNPHAPILESILQVTSFENWIDKSEINPGQLKGQKGLGFCGIGNPHSFEKTLRSLGLEILNAFFFLDHYIYTRKDLLSLQEEAKKSGAEYLITTEKDSVRLPNTGELTIPLLVVKVELKIISGEEKLWKFLKL
ncbi:MAG TPA: tetraacyldisaccharide 4'-kinase [Terriglobales bacterium]|nr:tetraacyldisaccharide 4'-kinase [Terriglobales bacterium]